MVAAAIESPDLFVTANERQIGALAIDTLDQFQTIRTLQGSADAAFTFGPRAARPASGAEGDRFLATDLNWLYAYSGTAWIIVCGVKSGTDAARAAYVPDATDDGAYWWTTDTCKLWEVSSGAWVDRFVSPDASTSYEVAGTKVVGTRKTGWTVATGTATRGTFDTATVTLPQLAEAVKALIDDLHQTAGHGLIGT